LLSVVETTPFFVEASVGRSSNITRERTVDDGSLDAAREAQSAEVDVTVTLD